MTIHAQCLHELPPLAWLARLTRGRDTDIELLHGPGVETGADWFIEGAWDGEFGAAGFDRTDVVVGTGGRLRDQGTRFVSYGNTLNRLHYASHDNGAFVSNSLPCLLAAMDRSLRVGYTGYRRDLFSIVSGLRRYRRHLPVDDGHVGIVYYDNLHWDGYMLTVVGKPCIRRDFGTFDRYRAFLAGTLERLATNAADRRRTYRYDLLGTLSGGYDSPGAMALAREAGCTRALHLAPTGESVDSIAPAIAEYLGVEVHSVAFNAWRHHDGRPEVPYIVGAPDAEDLRFESAGDLLANRILVTGAWGDVCWDPHATRDARHFRRTDAQGLSLSESRLWKGYQVLSVPMLGGLQVEEIRALGRSPGMRDWRIGGEYDRPIPRRLAEEAGVPRGAFARGKMGQSQALQARPAFLTPRSREDYSAWLRTHRASLPRHFGLKPDLDHDELYVRIGQPLRDTLMKLPCLWRVNSVWKMRSPARRFVFQWAVETLRAHYARVLAANASTVGSAKVAATAPGWASRGRD